MLLQSIIVLDYVEAIQSYEANSKDHYIAACKQCGVTPASYYIRNMKNIRLNMAHHGLGEKGVKALTMSLMVINFETLLFAKHLSSNTLKYIYIYIYIYNGQIVVHHMLSLAILFFHYSH